MHAFNGPLPLYRDKQTIAIGADDITFDSPVAVQAAGAGNLRYVTMDGTEQAEALTAGDTVAGPGGIPVLIKTIRGSSTLASAVVGII